MTKTLIHLTAICLMLPQALTFAETVGNPHVTINGTLSVNGQSGSNGHLNVTGLITGTGSGNNRLTSQILLNAAGASSHTIVTRGGGDSRYLQLTDFSITVAPYLSPYLPSNTAAATYVSKSEGATMTGPLTLSAGANLAVGGTTTFESTGSVTSDAAVTINNSLTVNNNNSTSVGPLAVNGVATLLSRIILGEFNVAPVVSNPAQGTDDLLIVGNGTSTTPANAFMIKRNGATTISAPLTLNGNLTVNGELQGNLHLEPQGDISMGEFTN